VDLQAGDAAPPAEHFPFDHPLYVMFSSGTTGLPKCIVHGAGGTLLEHLKEHRLHCDARPGDVLLFQTTSGWMMWQWMVSALGAGAEIVLYDGSPSHPSPDQLLRVIDESGVTLFGTNPTYLQFLRDSGIVPRDRFSFAAVRGILSTGSVLADALYDWTRDAFKAVPLQSISGGTDIIGCFVLGNPMLPVYRGESQCVSLGLDVRVLAEGRLSAQGRGELVCCRPFPSRPVGFLNDPDGSRFHQAYFSQNPGLWTHGDHIELTPRGTARVLGRSDSTLNVRGIRIGPAEIYSVVQQIPGVRQMLAVEQRDGREPGGSRIVLLLVLEDGTELDRALSLRIKKELATRASANHVPGLILAVPELPTTFSGKISERAARDALNGDPVTNRSALRNPVAVEHLERTARGSA
jgi:acetoacetyl-CoA synthetase